MEWYDLSGAWSCEIPGQTSVMQLPGTLDENKIGDTDNVKHQWHLSDVEKIGFYKEGDPIVTRLTRRYCYEGMAKITRTLHWTPPVESRIFFECERARHLSLLVNGQAVSCEGDASLSTPYLFEITDMLTGHDTLELHSDNSYPGWPYEAIIRSSAAADETQTNWNGILGYIRLRVEKPVFLEDVFVYPHGKKIDVCIHINAASAWKGRIRIDSPALQESAFNDCDVVNGQGEIWLKELELREDVSCWDQEEGKLYQLSVSADGLDKRSVSFGIRDFQAREGYFLLNNRRIFLRSETNCAVFPETGYPPMDVEAWREILGMYRSYGVNCMRFHSYCPPQAAFTAADELGMMMQPELSHWNPKNTFSTPDTCSYYYGEMKQILRMLANHPSFVMLTLGNELRADDFGHDYMNKLLKEAHLWDGTRLYANGSNTHYGLQGHDEASDFYTAMAYYDKDLRATSGNMQGWLNHSYPNMGLDYSHVVRAIREKTDQPVFSFEVGQYEVLPDFEELQDFCGVTDPANLRFIHEKADRSGLLSDWKEREEASGELSLLCYRAEVEAALRTDGMGGISLLGLQDFPGQGTALVGMLNSHLHSKPLGFAKPERFRAFFRDVLPLVLLPQYTYGSSEILTAHVHLANYGKQNLRGETKWSLTGQQVSLHGVLPETSAPAGRLTELGRLVTSLDRVKAPTQLTLAISFNEHKNEYPIWVYPNVCPVCPPGVYESPVWNDQVKGILEAGGCVYLSPESTKEALPCSVQGQFSTDFWSVCSFADQAGCMGLKIDKDHPVFSRFPTQIHTNWQWWPMAVQRAVILPDAIKTIVAQMDSCAYMRPMAQLFEGRFGKGKLLFSSMGLQNLLQYPEARTLLQAIYSYMDSGEFNPEQSLTGEWIDRLFNKQSGTSVE